MKFEAWVKPYVQKGKGYIAYNFNLYEFDEENEFGAELVASTSYDPMTMIGHAIPFILPAMIFLNLKLKAGKTHCAIF